MRSFFVKSVQKKALEYSLVTRGGEMNFWNPLTGEWNGNMKLPAGFVYNPDNFQSKNCQIHESDIGIGDSKGNIFLINVLKPEVKPVKLSGHVEQVRVICSSYELNPQKEVFLSGAEDDTIILWHRKLGSKMFSFDDHTNAVTDILIIRSDCTKFASTSRDGTLKVFDLKTQTCTINFSDQAGNSISSTVDEYSKSSMSPILFSSGGHNDVGLYNLNRKRKMNQIRGYGDLVTSIRCFPDEYKLVASDVSGTLYCTDWRNIKNFLWKFEDKNMIKVNRIIPNKANLKKFVICKDKFIQIHDLETGGMEKRMREKESVFGIFSFKSVPFAAKKKSSIHVYSLPLTRDLVRMRDEFGESEENKDLFEKVEKIREKEVVDNLGLTIRSQVKKLRSRRTKKIYRVYASTKQLRRQLASISKDWTEKVRKMMEMIDLFPIAVQNTQVEVQKIEDVRRSLVLNTPSIHGEKIPSSHLSVKSKSGFQETSLKKAKEKIEMYKKDIKQHWHDFNIFRNVIWKTLTVFKFSVAVLVDYLGKKKQYYVGSVRNQMADGLGIIFLKKGSYFNKIYEGQFKSDKKVGMGIEYSEDGEGMVMFEGWYKDGVRQGPGFLTQVKSGQCCKGKWVRGRLRNAKAFAFKVESFRVWEKYLEQSSKVNLIEPLRKKESEFFRIPKKKEPKSILVTTLSKYELESIQLLKKVFRCHVRMSARASKHENVLPVLSAVMDCSKMWFNKIGVLYGKEVSYNGSDLLLQGHGLGMATKLNLLLQVAQGLEHIHQMQGFFHGLNWKHCLLFDPKMPTSSSSSQQDGLAQVTALSAEGFRGRSSSKGGRGGAVIVGKDGRMKINRDDLKLYLHGFDTGEGWFRLKYLPLHYTKIESEYLIPNKEGMASNEERTSTISNSITVMNMTDAQKLEMMKRKDIYSFSLMMYCIFFDTLHPFEGVMRCPECKEDISASYDLVIDHIRTCNIRPTLEPYQLSKIPREYDWAIELMKMAWDIDEFQRPDLDTIIRVLSHSTSAKLVEVINLKDRRDRRMVILEESKLERLKKVVEGRFSSRTHGKLKRVFEMPKEGKKEETWISSHLDIFDDEEEGEEEETEGEDTSSPSSKKNKRRKNRDNRSINILGKKEITENIELVAYMGKCMEDPLTRIIVEFEEKKEEEDDVFAAFDSLPGEDPRKKRRRRGTGSGDDEYTLELERKLETLERKFSHENKKFKKTEREFRELSSVKGRLDSETRKLKASNQTFRNAQSNLSKKLEELEKKFEALESTNKGHVKRIKELEEENQTLKDEMNEQSTSEEEEISDGDFIDTQSSQNRQDDDDGEESGEEMIIIGGGGDKLASGIWESHAGEHKVGKEKAKKKDTTSSLSISSVRKPRVVVRRKTGMKPKRKPPPKPPSRKGRGGGKK